MGVFEDAISTLFGLIPLSIQWTLIFAVLSVYFLFWFNFIQKKWGTKWLPAAAGALVCGFFVLFFLLNVSNIWTGASSSDVEQIPYDVRENPLFAQGQRDVVSLLVSSFIQSLFSAIAFTLLLLPFAFLGVSVFDGMKPRMRGVWSRILFTCFIGSLVFIVLLAMFPWLLVSLVYLVYFGI